MRIDDRPLQEVRPGRRARRDVLSWLVRAATLSAVLGPQARAQSARKAGETKIGQGLVDYVVVWTGMEALEVGKHKDHFWLFRIRVLSESGEELGRGMWEFTIPKRTKGPEMQMETNVQLPAGNPRATLEVKAIRSRTAEWECSAHGQLELGIPIEMTLAMPNPKDGMFRLSFMLKRDDGQ